MVRAECRLHRRLETEGRDLPEGSYVNIAEYLERDGLPEYLRKAILSTERRKNRSASSIDLLESETSTPGTLSLSSSSYLPRGDYRRKEELCARLAHVYDEFGGIQSDGDFARAIEKSRSLIAANKLDHLLRYDSPGNPGEMTASVDSIPRPVNKEDFIALFVDESRAGLLAESSDFARVPSALLNESSSEWSGSKGNERHASIEDFTRSGFGITWSRMPRKYRGLGVDHLAKLRRDASRRKG